MTSTGHHSRSLQRDPPPAMPCTPGSSAAARSINVQFRARSASDAGTECAFVCECGRDDCISATVMTVAEHDWIAMRMDWLAVAPGHQEPADTVVQVHDRYLVVTRST